MGAGRRTRRLFVRRSSSGKFAGSPPGRVVTLTHRSEAQSSATICKLIAQRIIKHTNALLNATATDVAMEELVIAHDRLDGAS